MSHCLSHWRLDREWLLNPNWPNRSPFSWKLAMIIKIFPSQCELPFSYREGGKLKNFSVAFLYSWGRSSLEVYRRERRVVWERGHPGVTHFFSQFGPPWGQAHLLSAIQSPETLHYYWDTGSIYGCLIYPWPAVRVLTNPDTIIFPFGPPSSLFWAFQVVIEVKNLSANAGDVRDVGSIPGSGRSPGGGHGNPLQCSCLENPQG